MGARCWARTATCPGRRRGGRRRGSAYRGRPLWVATLRAGLLDLREPEDPPPRESRATTGAPLRWTTSSLQATTSWPIERRRATRRARCKSIRMRNWRKGRRGVDKTSVEWDALGFICQVPLDGTATCNVRPPASTARPPASTRAPPPRTPHPATRPRCSLGVTTKRRTACATTAGAGVRVSGPRTPPPRASSNFLAKRRFARATARTASTAARGRRSRTRGRPTLAECASAPPPASPLPPPLPASGLGATSCGRAGV